MTAKHLTAEWRELIPRNLDGENLDALNGSVDSIQHFHRVLAAGGPRAVAHVREDGRLTVQPRQIDQVDIEPQIARVPPVRGQTHRAAVVTRTDLVADEQPV